jgi:hypothetical protein
MGEEHRAPDWRSWPIRQVIRAAFSLVRFFWPRKRNEPGRGPETASKSTIAERYKLKEACKNAVLWILTPHPNPFMLREYSLYALRVLEAERGSSCQT